MNELMRKAERWLMDKGHNMLVMDTRQCPRCEELRNQKQQAAEERTKNENMDEE